jgi:hypothetical protein
MQHLDLNNLPEIPEAEEIVKSFDADTTLSYVNMFRERQLSQEDSLSEKENIIGILLVRHLRTLRQSKSRAAPKKTNALPPVSDLL